MKFLFGKFNFTISGLLLGLVQYLLALFSVMFVENQGRSLLELHQASPFLLVFIVAVILLPLLGFMADRSINSRVDEQQNFRPKYQNLRKYQEYLATYAEKVREEDFSIEMNLKRKDRLSVALEGIRAKLRDTRRQYEEQSWLINSLQQLRESLREPANSSEETCERTISNLVTVTGSLTGAIYLENGLQGSVVRKAAYAINPEQMQQDRFASGEGMVGQCFRDGKVLTLRDLDDRTRTHFTIGSIKPVQVVFIPIAYQGHIHGVLELSTSHELSQHELDFLELSTELLLGSLVGVLRKSLEEIPQSGEVSTADQQTIQQQKSRISELEPLVQKLRNEVENLKKERDSRPSASQSESDMATPSVQTENEPGQTVAPESDIPVQEQSPSIESETPAKTTPGTEATEATAKDHEEPEGGDVAGEERFKLLTIKKWLEEVSAMGWTRVSMRLLREFKDKGVQLNQVREEDTIDRVQMDKIREMTQKLYEKDIPEDIIAQARISGTPAEVNQPDVEEPNTQDDLAAPTETEEETNEHQVSNGPEYQETSTESQSPVETAEETAVQDEGETLEETSAPTQTQEVDEDESVTPVEQGSTEAEATPEEQVSEQPAPKVETEGSAVTEQEEAGMVHYLSEPIISWSERELSPLAWSSAISQSAEEIQKLEKSPDYFERKDVLIPENVMYIISNSFELNLKVEIPQSILDEAKVDTTASQEEDKPKTAFEIETKYEEKQTPAIHRKQVKSESEIQSEEGEMIDLDMQKAKEWIGRNISPIAWIRIVSRVGGQFRTQQYDLNHPEDIKRVPSQLADKMNEVVLELFDRDLLEGLKQDQKQQSSSASKNGAISTGAYQNGDEEAEKSQEGATSSGDASEDEASQGVPDQNAASTPGGEEPQPGEKQQESAVQADQDEVETAEEDKLQYKAIALKRYCDDNISPIAWIRATSRIARVLRKDGLKINNPNEDTLLSKRHVDLLSENIKEIFDVEVPDSVKYTQKD